MRRFIATTKAKSKNIKKEVKIQELQTSFYWDYRIIREDGKFSIVRVSYENLRISEYRSISENVSKEDLAELVANLASVLDAFSKPFLDVYVDGTLIETIN